MCLTHLCAPSAQVLISFNFFSEFSIWLYASPGSVLGFIHSGTCYHNSFYEFIRTRYPLHQLWVWLLFSSDSLLQSGEGFRWLAFTVHKSVFDLLKFVLNFPNSCFDFLLSFFEFSKSGFAVCNSFLWLPLCNIWVVQLIFCLHQRKMPLIPT